MNITGTKDADQLNGTAEADYIQGLGGGDRIRGEDGDDILEGGSGGDTIDGGAGSDVVEGGDGDDYLSDFNGGSDTLLGGAGADDIYFSHSGSGRTPEAVRIEAGIGNDQVAFYSYAAGTTSIDLGDGDDTLTLNAAAASAATITSGAGSDRIILSQYFTYATAPVFTDFATGGAGDALVLGEYLGGRLTGWDGANPFGAGGHLRLTRSGDDTLLELDRDGAAGAAYGFVTLSVFARTATDAFSAFNFDGYAPDGSPTEGKTLTGTENGDTLTGGAGDDTISGLGGSDWIDGKAGRDLIDGGDGADQIEGGAGDDQIDGGDGDDSVRDTAGGSDTLRGGAGRDYIEVTHYGASAASEQVRVEGGAGDDQLYIARSGGLAIVDLGEGDDRLTLSSALDGATEATLGEGRDTVTLYRAYGSGSATIITDFSAGPDGDVIDLGELVATSALGWNGADNPFGRTGFLRLIQSGADTLVQFDQDGAALTGDGPRTIAVLRGVAADALTADNLAGFGPDGGPLAGTTLTGTDRSDRLTGTIGGDRIEGLAGNDVLYGEIGHDVVDGGAGDDHVTGGVGDDLLVGGDGNDTINDDGGSVAAYGGAGNDRLNIWHNGYFGSTERVLIDGGAGDDELVYLNYTFGTAAIDMGDGADAIEILSAGNSGVALTLGAGQDVVTLGYNSDFGSFFVITDFTAGAGGDAFDLTDYLPLRTIGLSPSANPFESGHLTLVQWGAHTVVRIDVDGAARSFSGSRTVAILRDTDPSDFTAANFGGYAPIADLSSAGAIRGTSAADVLTGTDEGDTVSGRGGKDRIDAGGGDDLVEGGGGDDRILGGFGGDLIDGGAGADRMEGGAGNDLYVVDNAGDRVVETMGGGVDAVESSISHLLATEVENLTLIGAAADGAGNALANVITGNDAQNRLDGGLGNDVLVGLGGNDTLVGGLGADRMEGGQGNDFYQISEAGDVVVEAAGGGLDTVRSVVSFTLADEVENLMLLEQARVGTGNASANRITGSDGHDTLSGLGGDDVLLGGTGNDALLGGDGRDQLYGGPGRDVLTGGAGGDLFRFEDGHLGAGRLSADRVTDFDGAAGDRLHLRAVDADSTVAGDQAFRWIGGAAFSRQAGELGFDVVDGNTFIRGDVNGDGSADFVIRLDGVVPLQSGDMLL